MRQLEKGVSLGPAVFLAAGAAFSSSWAMDIVLAPGLPLVAVFGYSAIFLIALGFLTKERAVGISYVHLFMAMFMIWISVSALWSRSLPASASNIYYYFLSFCIFIAVASSCTNYRAWRLVGLSYCAGVFLSCAILVYNMYTGNISVDQRSGVGEVNPNYLAYALATGVPVVLAISSGMRHGLFRSSAGGIGVSIIFIGIMLTGSRSGLMAALLCLAAYAFIIARRAFFVTLFSATVIMLSVTFAYGYLPEALRVRLDITALAITGGTNVNENLSGRYDIWPIAWEYFRENPIGGIGIGSFDAVNQYGIRAHNFILSLGADVGLIGLLLYTLTVGSIMRLAYRSEYLRRYRGLTIMVVTVWVAVSLSGVWESSPAAWVVFAWLFSGARSARWAKVSTETRMEDGFRQHTTASG